MKTLIDNTWIREIHRNGSTEYTFCGALEYRYRHIAFRWNPDTRKKHEREYNNIILPALENHNEKSIRDYTKDDFTKAIEIIKDKGYVENGVRRQYSENSIKNFQNLIYLVVFQSSVYRLCDNVLWGTRFVLDMPDEASEIEESIRLKKSLSIKQEKCLATELLEDPFEEGARVALLLMWGLGLRNAEACALNYGDVKELEGHPSCYVAWIYKSTKIKTNLLQSGGKTYNSGRVVPVPEKIVEFLFKRLEILKRIINEQGMTGIGIESLPVCNNGYLEDGSDTNNLSERCKSDTVSIAAHEVFENAGITSRQLAYLDVELSEGNVASVLKEKEPTAYLLRRNFATQMKILGLTNSEMQYLIGHDVEDAYESRGEFVDSERIFCMYHKLQQRELLNNRTDYNKAEICIKGKTAEKIHISAQEPVDPIRITIGEPCKNLLIGIKWAEEVENFSGKRTVNLLEIYHNRYRSC